MKKSNLLHIAVIILGTIFISICAMHSSLWFDEAYSVSMAKHNFVEIWDITGHDVHPPVYYWFLHIIYLIFGNNILVFRLFSVLAIVILGIIGFTHIRKDFGEKTGFLFSFFSFFLPVITVYAQEIRMYSWSCLIIALTAIYAYRFYLKLKNKEEKGKIKNLVIFGIFSILACYIHYYALVCTAFINLFLLIYVIKHRKEDKKAFVAFLILAGIQIILYIPWLLYLAGQIKHVHEGFWIRMDIVQTPVETLSFQLRRQLDDAFEMNLHTWISFIASLLLYGYIIYLYRKAKREGDDVIPGKWSFIVYGSVILLMCVASLAIWRPVLFARYLFVLTGLWIFMCSFFLAKEEKRKYIIIIIMIVVVIFGIIANVQNCTMHLDASNDDVYSYLKDKVQDDDIFMYSNIGSGSVICSLFPNNKQYYLRPPDWDVEEAYKAFGPGMECVNDYSFLENYTGRIWVVDPDNYGFYDDMPKDNVVVLEETKHFHAAYHKYDYNLLLVEKTK